MIDMFETLAHFPDTVMMLRNGDNTVDAHSLMGFFAIDEKIPIELLLESEPDDNLKQAISKFAFVMHKNNYIHTVKPYDQSHRAFLFVLLVMNFCQQHGTF